MSVELREMINFHLTGKRSGEVAEPFPGVMPALLAPYRDLGGLRYDYPLILVEGPGNEAFVDTLTGIFNRLLRDIAPQGDEGAQLRQHLLRLEERLRKLSSEEQGALLSDLWQRAEKSLLADCDADEREWLGNSIATARFALRTEGVVVDCDAELPSRLITHAWQRLASGRGELADKIYRNIIKLRDFLKVDKLKQNAARSPTRLKAAVGKRHVDLFDFEQMAELLDDVAPGNVLPDARKQRLLEALDVLESQRFFAIDACVERYEFLFDNLSAALKAYDRRLEEMAAIVKALAIADLEMGNAYEEGQHDDYFERFGAQALTSEDISRFPSCLVCIDESECTPRDLARLIEIVTCDLPIKVMIHVSEPLGMPAERDGLAHKGSFAQQLATTFVAGNAFVMQSPVSALYRQRDDIRKCLECAGPAIMSIYAPVQSEASALPSYLLSAAALESRVFPAFRYDPGAGDGLAERFDISHNPDVDADWPQRRFSYEDEELQVCHEDLSFTLADFAVTQRGYREHFAPAAEASCKADLIGVAEYVERPDANSVEGVPAIAVVDSDDLLQHLVVDEKLIRMSRRCRDRWRTLQQLAGVHGSLVSGPPLSPALEEPPAPELLEPADAKPDSETVPETEPGAFDAVGDEVAGSADDPYIETPRCTTCDECTKRNDRMFAYDENRQAYIRDPDAGTFRELVEAAEMCQVAIIHPGSPRNPDESGLDELVRRAEPFNA